MPRSTAPAIVIEPLSTDIVALAQCMAIDADAFPYASVPFGLAVRDKSARIWVARDGQEEERPRVLGFLAGTLTGGPGRQALRVLGLAVSKGERRRGVGRALLRAALAWATARGKKRSVSLQVSTTNCAAIALYESEGFAVRRRLAGYYPRGAYGDGGDAFEMVFPA